MPVMRPTHSHSREQVACFLVQFHHSLRCINCLFMHRIFACNDCLFACKNRLMYAFVKLFCKCPRKTFMKDFSNFPVSLPLSSSAQCLHSLLSFLIANCTNAERLKCHEMLLQNFTPSPISAYIHWLQAQFESFCRGGAWRGKHRYRTIFLVIHRFFLTSNWIIS